jgi:hypothetical protein
MMKRQTLFKIKILTQFWWMIYWLWMLKSYDWS